MPTNNALPRVSSDEFRDEGFLVEVNRRVLHPLGLAMAGYFVQPIPGDG